MVRYVLTAATGARSDAPMFRTALTVARAFGAHLEFLHVRPDVQEAVAMMAAADIGGGWALNGAAARLEQAVARRAQAAAEAFHGFCAREGVAIADAPQGAGVSASLSAVTGDGASCLAGHGRFADLVVLGRMGEDEAAAADVLNTVLMTSGRPVLISPETVPDSVFGTIAIAWKNTPEAARAVAAASPFIARARRVVVLVVNEESPVRGSSPDRLRRALRWHNPNVAVECLASEADPQPAETLLRAARRLDAALLVMGGYGRGRLREWLFGGFTAHVMNRTTLPVLMMH